MNDALVERRADARFAAAFGALGLVWTWVTTGPAILALINWDNAAYVANSATGRMTWSYPPWNNHFGVHLILWGGVKIARLFGGTDVDGFRLVEAVFFGIACAVMADLLRRLVRDRLLAGLLTGAWMAAWVNLFLIITLEYNILFLATGAMLFWLCVVRVDAWNWRTSIAAGLIAGVGVLVSWQAGLYLAPPFYVALFFGRAPRSPLARARDATLLVVAFALVLNGTALLIGLIGENGVKQAFHVLYSRPVPAYIPSGAKEWAHVITDVRLQAHIIGTSVSYQLAHTCYKLPPLPFSVEVTGFLTYFLIVGLYGFTTWRARRDRRWAMHVVAASLLLFTFFTSLYKDVEYAYLKRFNFLPLLFAISIAGLLGDWSKTAKLRKPIAAVLALAIAAQVGLWWRWDRARLASYPTLPSWIMRWHPPEAFYGRDGKSWFAYFRSLKRAHPNACRFVLAYEEIMDGKWNNDIDAALWSELPNHVVLGYPGLVRFWRFPPKIYSVDYARKAGLLDACAYVSPDAQHVIETAP